MSRVTQISLRDEINLTLHRDGQPDQTRRVNLREFLSARFGRELPSARLNRILQQGQAHPRAIIGTDREGEFRNIEGYQTVRDYAAAQDRAWMRAHTTTVRVDGSSRVVPRGTLVLSRQRTEELNGIRRGFGVDQLSPNLQSYYNQVQKLYVYGNISRAQFTRYWNMFQHAGENDQRGVADQVARGIDLPSHARFVRDCLAHLRRH